MLIAFKILHCACASEMAPCPISVCVCFLMGIIFSKNVDASPLNLTISNHPIILVVSYDGFRWDYFDRVDTPNLDGLKASGVRVPYLKPTFPTRTFVNHQSIATGLYAEAHGVVDNIVYDPQSDKELSGYGNDPGFWNYDGEVLPIWIRNELAGEGRTSGCLMWPGSSQPYGKENDLYPTYFYPGYDAGHPWEDRVETVISWMTNGSNPANLVFLYYDEPDAKGHVFGPNAPEIEEEIRRADKRTAYLVEKLKEVGIFDKINLIMLSDHGMKEVTPRHIINLTGMIDPELVGRRHGKTPVLHFKPKEGKGDELFDRLGALSKTENFTVWRKEESLGFFYGASRRILDYVVVADSGYAFDDFYRKMGKYNQKWNLTVSDSREYGVHGYSNEIAEMRAFFLAHGPAFKKDFENPPFRNIDIVPLISTILRIPEPPCNGSLENVKNMIAPEFLEG